MARTGVARAERQKSSWGAQSIDWNRCSDPNYYGELACEMHTRNVVSQETVHQHHQVVGLLSELLRCFSSQTSPSTKRNIADMLGNTQWRPDGGLTFTDGGSHDLFDYTDYYAGDEGEQNAIIYAPNVPHNSLRLADVTNHLASVQLGDDGHAARAA